MTAIPVSQSTWKGSISIYWWLVRVCYWFKTVFFAQKFGNFTARDRKVEELEREVNTRSNLIFTARKRSLGQGNIFTPVCHSVHRGGGLLGGCLVQGGSALGGGDLLLGGGAWPGGGVLLWGGSARGGGVPGPRGCLVETSPDGYCCRQYASYWNAFLLRFKVQV